jgi:predicted Fe-Mo cluster-binding NifX family protein
MKVAMTVWGNRVSPVFDSAQTILLADIDDMEITGRKREFIPVTAPSTMAGTLVKLNIDTLICGAISRHPAEIIEEAGITLLPFITGNAEKILEEFARKKPMGKYIMPGCGHNMPDKKTAS